MSKIIKSVDVVDSTFSPFQRDVLEECAFRRDADESAGNAMYVPDPAEILAEARRQADALLQEAYQEGLKRGVDAGRQSFLDSVGQSAEALTRAAEAMRRAREEFLGSLEPQAVRLASAIAERVIRREVQTDPARMARACLHELVDRERVTVRLNPGDCETLQKEDISLLEQFDGVKQLQVVADDAVEPGGCLVDTETILVDGQLSAQVERGLDNLTE